MWTSSDILGVASVNNNKTALLVSSAWAMVLFYITGEEDVVYGQVVTGRNSDILGIAEMVSPA